MIKKEEVMEKELQSLIDGLKNVNLKVIPQSCGKQKCGTKRTSATCIS